MDAQRQRAGGGRRRRKAKKSEPKPKTEPVLIAARRPDSPRMLKVSRRGIAASAQPKQTREGTAPAEAEAPGDKVEAEKPRRAARILQTKTNELTEDALREERLIERLRLSEGRTAITAAANAIEESGLGFPEQQDVQLQLLEHSDEQRASQAILVIRRLLEEQDPIKRPILDQRLRRLEDEAEDSQVRLQAAELRRYIRVA